MTTAHAALHVLRVVGYANFVALTAVVLSAKGGSDMGWLPSAAPPLIALCGAAMYYFAWPRLFPDIARAEGRHFMRPYLLGVYLMLAAAALLLALVLLNWRGRR